MYPESGFIIVFFYKGLTRNPEIGNTPSEFWPIPQDWGELRIPNLSRMSLMKCQDYSFKVLSFLSY